MSIKRQDNPEEQEHKHRFCISGNLAEEYCDQMYKDKPCKVVRISREEEDRRREEWAEYYRMCKEAPGYQDYLEMQAIFGSEHRKFGKFSDEDIQKIRAIRARVRERCDVVIDRFGDENLVLKDKLKQPPFEDPDSPYFKVVYSDAQGDKYA